MIEVNKEIGKMLRKKAPKLCVKTSHGRHYYATETPRVFHLIEEFETSEVSTVYPKQE